MKFEWDSAKNNRNIKIHHVDFNTASEVFNDPNRIEMLDKTNYSSNEERWDTIGYAKELLFVVYTERVNKNGEEVTRIISARVAESHEEALYARNLY